MGKSNSKLKPEVVEELTRKTYCIRALLRTVLVVSWIQQASRRSTSNSFPAATPPSSPASSSTCLTRTRMDALSLQSLFRPCRSPPGGLWTKSSDVSPKRITSVLVQQASTILRRSDVLREQLFLHCLTALQWTQ
uniref:Uncharacterized protein n=1 Tax=Esox lucius TaxID=8010 RepID=A0AAY5KWL1_ESOLU